MKKRPSLTPAQLFWYAAILLLFTLFLLSLLDKNKKSDDAEVFHNLTRELFVSEMTSNTLNMHYTLAYPEDFGISDYKAVLPDYRQDSYEESCKAVQDTLDTLAAIDPASLSAQDALLYRLLQKKLGNSLQLNRFPYYDEPLSPSSGVQSQLPVLLAEYTFRCRLDVEDYLTLLDQTDTYFASLLSYEQARAAAGLSQSTYSLKQVQAQCDTIVTKEALESGDHFLQTTFEERLHTLIESGEITKKDAEQYISQNNRLLRTVVQPAYEALADGLFLLEDGDGIPDLPRGLSSLPRGQEYYKQLLISQTGSYRPVPEIKSMLEQSLTEEYSAMRKLLTDHPGLREQLVSDSYAALPIEDAESMLADLQSRMAADFPLLPAAGDLQEGSPKSGASADNSASPQVTVKNVSENLQEYCAPAFYLTAPLDDTDNNVIYINPKNSPNRLELYTTLAHEGFPGHLYQTVYHNQNSLKLREEPARGLLWYGGYLEGWALYVEFYSYDYAIDMLNEQNRAQDALCVELERHNRSLLLCLYSTLDVMIHYDGATREDVAKYLSAFGIDSETAANAVYNYIADEPCNYLKYYLGYLEILQLKKAAQEGRADALSDYEFHKFLLDAGPADFSTLSELLGQSRAKAYLGLRAAAYPGLCAVAYPGLCAVAYPGLRAAAFDKFLPASYDNLDSPPGENPVASLRAQEPPLKETKEEQNRYGAITFQFKCHRTGISGDGDRLYTKTA